MAAVLYTLKTINFNSCMRYTMKVINALGQG